MDLQIIKKIYRVALYTGAGGLLLAIFLIYFSISDGTSPDDPIFTASKILFNMSIISILLVFISLPVAMYACGYEILLKKRTISRRDDPATFSNYLVFYIILSMIGTVLLILLIFSLMGGSF